SLSPFECPEHAFEPTGKPLIDSLHAMARQRNNDQRDQNRERNNERLFHQSACDITLASEEPLGQRFSVLDTHSAVRDIAVRRRSGLLAQDRARTRDPFARAPLWRA